MAAGIGLAIPISTWEDFLPFTEFAYNKVVHIFTHCSLFEIVYGFNHLTPIDLLPLPSNEVVNFQVDEKTTAIEDLRKEVKERIEKQNVKVAEKVNQHRKPMVFKERDLVWVHLRKERFPYKRDLKLKPKRRGTFSSDKKINDHAYHINLKGKYGVSATFNVYDYPFWCNEFDLRINPSKGEKIMIWTKMFLCYLQDQLQVLEPRNYNLH